METKIIKNYTYFFECQCYSDEHILKFNLDGENKEIYTTIFLNQYRNIFKRIWIGIKYIFGYKCKYGHWDTFLMKAEDVDRMIEMLNKFKEL